MLPPRSACPDCATPRPLPTSRRAFLKSTALGLAAAAGSGPAQSLLSPATLAAPSRQDTSETLAAQLHKSLSADQRGTLCFPFDDPLRHKVDNNWLITKKPIRDVLDPDQQDLVRQIFRALHAPDFADRAMEQMVHDAEGKGFDGGTSVALFGEPAAGGFEFVITGRHCTRRCDGDTVAGAAFGGPIFYGHQAGTHDTEPSDHPGNVFWYQAKRANEVFQALDGSQRRKALVDAHGRAERATETARLPARIDEEPGIRIGDLTPDQRGLVRQVMADLLSPFRAPDAQEALRCVEAMGLDSLRLAFFKQQDLGNDGVWDVWQITGPSLVWYFRGDPHVHCWVHLRDPRAKA